MRKHREQRHAVRHHEPGKIDDGAKQLGYLLGDRRDRHPAGRVPDQDDPASLSDAASFTAVMTACVRSSCVTPATGDGSAANAARSKGRTPSDFGAIVFPRRREDRASAPRMALGFEQWRDLVPGRAVVPAAVDQDESCFGFDIADPLSFELRRLRPLRTAAGDRLRLRECRKRKSERPCHQGRRPGGPPQSPVPPGSRTRSSSRQDRRK